MYHQTWLLYLGWFTTTYLIFEKGLKFFYKKKKKKKRKELSLDQFMGFGNKLDFDMGLKNKLIFYLAFSQIRS